MTDDLIVPRVPTIEMVIAGVEESLLSRPDLEGEYVTRIFAAMTLAAPKGREG